jgi:hypothetical protein
VNWQGWTITPELTAHVAGKVDSPVGKLTKDTVAEVVNPDPVTVTTCPTGPEFGEPETGRRVTVASGEKLTFGPAETKDWTVETTKIAPNNISMSTSDSFVRLFANSRILQYLCNTQ